MAEVTKPVVAEKEEVTYPRWLHHPTQDSILFQSKEEEDNFDLTGYTPKLSEARPSKGKKKVKQAAVTSKPPAAT